MSTKGPCPCISLRTAAKLVAVLQMVTAIVELVVVVIFALHLKGCSASYMDALFLTPVIFVLLIALMDYSASILLYIGVCVKSRKCLCIGLVLTGICVIISALLILQQNVFAILSFLQGLYCMRVLFAFRANINVVPTQIEIPLEEVTQV